RQVGSLASVAPDSTAQLLALDARQASQYVLNMRSAKKKVPATKVKRNFPTNTLEQSLAVAQKIADERGGKPFKRLLLAEALGYTPSSSTYRVLLSSAYKYGLTEGTEKASDIGLTELGAAATQQQDAGKRLSALRQAALTPSLFKTFFEDYKDKKLPS